MVLCFMQERMLGIWTPLLAIAMHCMVHARLVDCVQKAPEPA